MALKIFAVLAPMKKVRPGTNNWTKAPTRMLIIPIVRHEIIRKGKNEYRLVIKIMQVKNDYSIVLESSTTKRYEFYSMAKLVIIPTSKMTFLCWLWQQDCRMESFNCLRNNHTQISGFWIWVWLCLLYDIAVYNACKNLLYTGITRAKKEIAIIRSEKAMAIAIKAILLHREIQCWHIELSKIWKSKGKQLWLMTLN